MTNANQPMETMTFEIDRYRGMPKSPESYVVFAGALDKHPHDRRKVILIPDPFSSYVTFFEFNRADIGGLEELPSLVSREGDTVPIFRVWVKKGSIAVQCLPFIVEDISGRWNR